MRIKPSSGTPPYSYEGLPVLPRPAQGRSFAALASRVALFGRDGVVDVGSRMLWQFGTIRKNWIPMNSELPS